jgi:hypothetical protein
MIPILLLNGFLVAMSWWVIFIGAFIGPVLMMTSNAILGKPLKVWGSVRKGIFSTSFFKMAFASLIYLALIYFINRITGVLSLEKEIGILPLFSSYIIFIPVWVFIPMAMLLERKGLQESVKRSFQILQKKFFAHPSGERLRPSGFFVNDMSDMVG